MLIDFFYFVEYFRKVRCIFIVVEILVFLDFEFFLINVFNYDNNKIRFILYINFFFLNLDLFF